MTFEEYVEKAVQFAPNGEPEMLLAQGMLGLIGEIGEFCDNPTADELGDCWWYLAILDWAMHRIPQNNEWSGVDLKRPSPKQIWNGSNRFLSPICNEVEKISFQKREGDFWYINQLGLFFPRLLNPQTYPGIDKSLEEIWEQNIQKLEERHGKT